MNRSLDYELQTHPSLGQTAELNSFVEEVINQGRLERVDENFNTRRNSVTEMQ